ncbi:MAG TPA: efflux RND transporter periplasmic adaptor subunit [Anaerolineae bacterium]|nr:efflux RND transporter periplasmic adaptor subunit [Anaerolineae bacterium]
MSELGQMVDRAREWVQTRVDRAPGRETETLVASGTIQADEIRVASELGGRIVELEVEPGDQVVQGDLLILLDDTPLQVKLREAEAAVAVAEAHLKQVQAGPRAAEVDAARAALAQARAVRDGQEAAWKSARQALEDPQALDAQIAEAQTQVDLAEQGAALAEAQLAKEQLIRDQKREGSMERDIAEWQVVAAEEQLASARADLEAARTLLNGLWAIRNQPLGLIVQARVAEGQYRVTEAGVGVAEAGLADLVAGPSAPEVTVAEHALALERAKAAAIRAQQRRFRLTSPVDGIVLEQVLHAGELAAPTATILTIADLEQLTLTVYVPATEVGHVQLGQSVRVAVDSFPGREFEGRVAHISEEPEFTPRNVTTQEERVNTFYAVEVELDNPDGQLKPGMPADATF